MKTTYQHLFAEAIGRTLKFNIDIPLPDLKKIGQDHTQYATSDNIQGAFNHVYKSLGGFKSEDLVGKCLECSLDAKPHFEKYLNTPTVLTFGYIIQEGKEYYKFDELEIARRINGMTGRNGKINVHAWLTLPSLEIIDLTHIETLRSIMGTPFNEETGFKYIFNNLDSLSKQSLAYYPMLVGEDCLLKLNWAVPVQMN